MRRDPDRDQAILNTYEKILAFIPGLKEQIEWTQINAPSGIDKLAVLVRVRYFSLGVISCLASH